MTMASSSSAWDHVSSLLVRTLGVWGLGFGVWGLGFGDWGLGFGVRGLCRMHAHLNIVRPELPRRVSEQGIEHAQALQFGGSAVDALDDSKGRVSGRVSQVTHVW
jgi:hypothetical protein